MNSKKLKEILEKHKKWLRGEEGGERAILDGEDLSGASLNGASLDGASLNGASLDGASLNGASLSSASLNGASLDRASLNGASLNGASLNGASLSSASLNGASLRNASLDDVFYSETTAFFALQCPEKGAYIGYKKAGGLIVELEIPADAMRSSATTRKCRASKAKVLSITTVDGEPAGSSVASDRDSTFIYTIGETVEVKDFETNRWIECAAGIHHFITRDEAVKYG